jgi:protein SCO1/2
VRRLLVLMATVFLLSTGCSSEPEELSGFVRNPLPNVSSASLPDVSNEGVPFSMQAPAGKILVLYFGYTSCPDVCPTTLADLRAALEEAGDTAENVTVAMATIDPERDTDEVITGYVQSFIPEAHALRTDSEEELRAAADTLGADYGVTVTDEGKYEVFHTAHLYAIDDAGMLQVTWPFGTEPASIADDLEILIGAG